MATAAEDRKRVKYFHLGATHHFTPLVGESLGVLSHEARAFLCDLACRLISTANDRQLHQFLLQQVVAIHHGNAVFVDDWEYGELIIFLDSKHRPSSMCLHTLVFLLCLIIVCFGSLLCTGGAFIFIIKFVIIIFFKLLHIYSKKLSYYFLFCFFFATAGFCPNNSTLTAGPIFIDILSKDKTFDLVRFSKKLCLY